MVRLFRVSVCLTAQAGDNARTDAWPLRLSEAQVRRSVVLNVSMMSGSPTFFTSATPVRPWA